MLNECIHLHKRMLVETRSGRQVQHVPLKRTSRLGFGNLGGCSQTSLHSLNSDCREVLGILLAITI